MSKEKNILSILRARFSYFNNGTDPKVIFSRVCKELAKRYKPMGFEHSVYDDGCEYGHYLSGDVGDIWIKIGFWPSIHNISSQFIDMEIIPYYFSKRLANEEGKKIEESGCVWGHPEVFFKYHKCPDGYNEYIIPIVGAPKYFVDECKRDSLQYGRYIDLYKFNDEKYERLTRFLDDNVIKICNKLQDPVSLEKMLDELDDRSKENIVKGNKKIFRYVEIVYPELLEKVDMIINLRRQ